MKSLYGTQFSILEILYILQIFLVIVLLYSNPYWYPNLCIRKQRINLFFLEERVAPCFIQKKETGLKHEGSERIRRRARH